MVRCKSTGDVAWFRRVVLAFIYLSSCYILIGKPAAPDEAQIRVPLIHPAVMILAAIFNGCEEIKSEQTRQRKGSDGGPWLGAGTESWVTNHCSDLSLPAAVSEGCIIFYKSQLGDKSAWKPIQRVS